MMNFYELYYVIKDIGRKRTKNKSWRQFFISTHDISYYFYSENLLMRCKTMESIHIFVCEKIGRPCLFLYLISIIQKTKVSRVYLQLVSGLLCRNVVGGTLQTKLEEIC